jgi:leader peptidase (prepilin peptidase)/N-methyltransferase
MAGFSACTTPRTSTAARHPFPELATVALFAATIRILGTDDGGELVLGLAFCGLLVVVTVTDMDRRVIPNAVLAAGALSGMAIAVASDPGSLGERAIGAGGAGAFLLLVALAHPHGMGMGDVKLAVIMGLYLGRSVAPALLVGFGTGALVGVALIARRGPGARKQAIAFGPPLALGGVVSLWWGDAMVEWYLRTFLAG